MADQWVPEVRQFHVPLVHQSRWKGVKQATQIDPGGSQDTTGDSVIEPRQGERGTAAPLGPTDLPLY